MLLPSQPKLVLVLLSAEGRKTVLAKLADYILRWFIRPQTVTH